VRHLPPVGDTVPVGSRAVVLVCRDGAVAQARFGATGGTSGAVYTRTGYPFFAPDRTEDLLSRLRAAVAAAGLWERWLRCAARLV